MSDRLTSDLGVCPDCYGPFNGEFMHEPEHCKRQVMEWLSKVASKLDEEDASKVILAAHTIGRLVRERNQAETERDRLRGALEEILRQHALVVDTAGADDVMRQAAAEIERLIRVAAEVELMAVTMDAREQEIERLRAVLLRLKGLSPIICGPIVNETLEGRLPVETTADSEVEAWLFHCWKPGTHSVFASVDKEDTSWGPLSEWKGVERTPLVRGAAPELIHGERMPRAGHIYSPREGSNVCFICGFHKREHAAEHFPPSPLKASGEPR